MKIFTTKLLALVTSALLLGACSQMATYENEDLTNGLEKADQAGFNLNPYNTSNGLENAKTYESGSWVEGCIPGDGTFAKGDFYVTSYEHIYDVTSSPVKKVVVEVYNTPTQLIYKFTASGDEVKYIEFNGDFIVNGTGTLSHTKPVDLSSSWVAGTTMTATINVYRQNTNGNGGGNKATFNTSYNLVGICTTTTLSAGTIDPICEGELFNLTATVSTAYGNVIGGYIQIVNTSTLAVVASAEVTDVSKQVQYSVPTDADGSFTYSAQYVKSDPFRYQGSVSATTSTVVVIDCGGCDDEFSAVTACSEDGSMRTATFTLIAGENGAYKVQGGLTNFTGEDAIVTVDGNMIASQRTPGGSSNRVITATGALDECDEVTITVSWNSSNGDLDDIIGNWSVDLNGEKILILESLGCNASGTGVAPAP